MKSGAHDLIAGAFAHQTAPFAAHPLDRARAAKYLHAAISLSLGWDDAEHDIRFYLAGQGCTPEMIQAEVERARPLLAPWLALG